MRPELQSALVQAQTLEPAELPYLLGEIEVIRAVATTARGAGRAGTTG